MNWCLLKQTMNCSSCSSLMVLLPCAASKSADLHICSDISISTFYSKRFIIEIIETHESTFTDLAVQEKRPKYLNKLCKQTLDSSPFKRLHIDLPTVSLLSPKCLPTVYLMSTYCILQCGRCSSILPKMLLGLHLTCYWDFFLNFSEKISGHILKFPRGISEFGH